MIISEDTKKVIDFLNDFSENNLRKSNDLSAILEIGATFGLVKSINELIFCGTSIKNLHYTLKHLNESDSSYHSILNELNNSIYEITKLLTEIAKISDNQDIINRFQNIYLQETNGSLLNIIDFSNDLYYLKKLQQTSKSKKSNAYS